ncbi:MAG TPA: class I SAM-dependent methyltransferase [Acidobacteriaceae bacterium]|jgi:SAM-dependent methyltransferase|nr:class I SAM-dependent methyltransferase [Acidobacteriaceae bacterium]
MAFTAPAIDSEAKADYGVDAPKVLRNLFVIGLLLVVLVFITPPQVSLGPVHIQWHYAMGWTGGVLLLESGLFLLYVKVGKFHHRDSMLALHTWRGEERVLDVGCGRGLLLAGTAKRLTTGQATGLDIWSNQDMGGNSEAATQRNLQIEGIADRCTLVSAGAQAMPFADASFDVVVSNLCLHNIYDKPTRLQAVDEIARVLKPGGVALLSDYKHTGEYAAALRRRGFTVERRWGSIVLTFPPLRVVVARKPAA